MAFRTNKTPVLQEKSASGSVATFNTALAMPLSSCKIAVNAWQEGSGDPSPSNVRAIHGFSVLNATRAGKNLLNGVSGSRSDVTINYDSTTGEYTINGTATSNWLYSIELPYVLPAGNYVISAINQPSDIVIRLQNSDGVTAATLNIDSANSYRPYTTNYNVSKYIIRINGGTTYTNYKLKLQLEVGSKATAYEPYVTPTIYPIQLGQEVYGAEVDVVNGVAHVTHIKLTVGQANWLGKNGNFFQTQIYNELVYTGDMRTGISDKFEARVGTASRGECWISNNGRINVYPLEDYADVASLYSAIGDVDFVMPLGTPFDIQLTPTQIQTLIGNNTIFCDTGDIDLTFKDLDIAKRGNFREVFRLPS